jgi:4-carboxymuconolactone decarboxylase
MPSKLFEEGLSLRKEVLGNEYVEKSINGADEFSFPMQEYATEVVWGMIWSRPGLSRKMRSLINIALLAAMNRPHEFKLHIKSASTNNVTKEEIKEVLLHIACYAGVAAGIDSFRLAREALAEKESAANSRV